MVETENKKNNPESAIKIRLEGRSVSRGVAIGKAVCLYGKNHQFIHSEISAHEVDFEIKRFKDAVSRSKVQVKRLHDSSTTEIQTGIFDTHLLILEDDSLFNQIEDLIRKDFMNAEWAVSVVLEKYLRLYESIENDYLREREVDITDVLQRLQIALGGRETHLPNLEKDSIIITKELLPSTLVELNQNNLSGIITENGGWTSHSFILAREFNLPAVTGVVNALSRIKSGDMVIVDGYHGQVILKPNDTTLEKYQVAVAKFIECQKQNYELTEGKLLTLDGQEIIIRANLESPHRYAKAKKIGAKGIGLYRSEYLIKHNRILPSEKKQIKAYREIAERVGQDGVSIRTFDLNIEDLSPRFHQKEKNPALGLRAIRLSLKHDDILRTQMRALLIASVKNNLSIVFPMISDVSEIRRAKAILADAKTELHEKGIKFANPKLGAMIEVPAAVFMVKEIAAEVDFLSLGTNDLVQYMLAVDRDNESVADIFRTLHPAVLRSIKFVIDSAKAVDTTLIICGEMAGSPVYATVLAGLGATEFSMSISAISRVKRILSRINTKDVEEIIDQLLTLPTADDVEEYIRVQFLSRWAMLFSPEFLPSKRK